MSTSATPAAVEPQQPLSESSRIINTFIAPSQTFTDLKRKSSWWVPYLLLAIMTIAVAFAASQKVGWEQLNENQLKLNPKRAAQMENMPAPDRARAQQMGVVITKAISYGFPLLLLIGLATYAGILLFTFNFGAGAAIGYSTALAVVVYASLPELMRSLLTVIFLYAGVVSPEGFVLQNPIGSNLAALTTPGTAMYVLASGVDVFRIWSIVLTAIGFTYVSRVKRGTSFAIVCAYSAILTLFFAGITALTS